MVRSVIRSILHDGPIKLFLVPASAPQSISHSSQCSMTGVTKAMLSCLWYDAYKRTLAANQKE